MFALKYLVESDRLVAGEQLDVESRGATSKVVRWSRQLLILEKVDTAGEG